MFSEAFRTAVSLLLYSGIEVHTELFSLIQLKLAPGGIRTNPAHHCSFFFVFILE